MTTVAENLNSGVRNSQGIKRVPSNPDEPTTLAGLFITAEKEHPRKNALNFKKDGLWQPISTDQMISRITAVAYGLHAHGIRKGDRVAILADNSPDWTITDGGCQFSGVIDVPIYTTLTPKSVEYIIRDSGAKVLFLQNRATYERLAQNLGECASIEKFVFFDSASVEPDIGVSLAEFENTGREYGVQNPGLLDQLSKDINSDDIATLIYTSGTTGEPKGVMLTNGNLVSNIVDSGTQFAFSSEDIPLSVLPLSHVFERAGMYLYIYNGMGVYYGESIEKVAENLREVRPTIFVGVPRIFEKVYQKAKFTASEKSPYKARVFDWAIDVGKDFAQRTEAGQSVSPGLKLKHQIADRLVFAKLRGFFGGRLRFCITGGAALSREIGFIFKGANISIMQGYGLTETSPVITTNTPRFSKVGTVGKPIRNVRIRIAPDGEIEASGPNIMLGYFNKPDATRETFTEDGWFKTGDIGEIDADGFLKITDRKKELFKTSGGKYIAPALIEQLIKASSFVNQVVLVGNERKFAAALVVPNFEQLASFARAENIIVGTRAELCIHSRVVREFETQVSELTQELARYERVKKIVLIAEEFTVEGGELTPTLKVKRRVIDEKYSEIIENIYAEN